MAKLLEKFGDTSAAVRDATDGVARAVMANLSSQGDILQGLLQVCNDLTGACIWQEEMAGQRLYRDVIMCRREIGPSQPAGRSGQPGLAQQAGQCADVGRHGPLRAQAAGHCTTRCGPQAV